jgi:hypothetical protein
MPKRADQGSGGSACRLPRDWCGDAGKEGLTIRSAFPDLMLALWSVFCACMRSLNASWQAGGGVRAKERKHLEIHQRKGLRK